VRGEEERRTGGAKRQHTIIPLSEQEERRVAEDRDLLLVASLLPSPLANLTNTTSSTRSSQRERQLHNGQGEKGHALQKEGHDQGNFRGGGDG